MLGPFAQARRLHGSIQSPLQCIPFYCLVSKSPLVPGRMSPCPMSFGDLLTIRSSPVPKIFISYRRDDTEHITGRMYDRLKGHFGDDSVFIDIDNMPLGVDFREHLQKAVGQCDILLAVIGDSWLEVSHREGPKAGQRRLDDLGDFVRIEVQAALDRGIPVIPVLVAKATMPGEEMLPQPLQRLAYRNATEVRSGRDFHVHMDRLVRGIEHLAKHATAPQSASAKSAATAAGATTPATGSTKLPPLPAGECRGEGAPPRERTGVRARRRVRKHAHRHQTRRSQLRKTRLRIDARLFARRPWRS